MQVQVADLPTLLSQSAATPEFREAVLNYQAHRSADLITTNPGAPHVKVLRVISKLLEEASTLEIRSVDLDGRSGCSSFHGTLGVNDGEAEFRFVWDCAWRAKQQGWRDAWGTPDQIRAAQTFGYQCFQTFERTR